MWSTAFRSLGTEVQVTTDDPVTAETLASLTSTYEPVPVVDDQTTRLVFRLSSQPAPGLFRDGTLISDSASVEVVDLPSLFQQDLHRELIMRCGEGWILHSAALASGGGATLLVGPSEIGKSTLALALVKRGAAYITDECASVDSTGQVRGVTRPFSFSDIDAPPLLSSDFSTSPYRCRSRSGALFDAVLVAPPSSLLCHRPQPLRFLIVLNRDPAARPGLCRLSAGEALCQLWPDSMRRDDRSLETAIELLAHHEAYQLTIGEVDPTCDRILDLWSLGVTAG